MLKNLLLPSVAIMAAFMGQAAAQAPAWPTKPVRVISAYAAGGTNELAARPIINYLSGALGQQFLLEAKPGKTAGARAVKAAPAARARTVKGGNGRARGNYA